MEQKEMERGLPFVDIIVPIYNVEAFLPQCIDSLLNQSYKNINIILVNDGSKDKSVDICERYVPHHSNMLLLNKENGGLSDARNYGLKYSSADYVMFVDSDDWIDKNMVNDMMSYFSESVDIVTSSYCLEYDNGTQYLQKQEKEQITVGNKKSIELVLNRKVNVSAWGKIYRRKLFEDIEYPVGCLHEDIPVIFRILNKARNISITWNPYYHYRQQNASISHGLYSKRNFKLYEFVDEAKWILEKYPELHNNYCGFYYFYVKSLLLMFGNKDTKREYKDDYKFLRNILHKNIIKILFCKNLSVKDKISIVSSLTPFHDWLKKIYRR